MSAPCCSACVPPGYGDLSVLFEDLLPATAASVAAGSAASDAAAGNPIERDIFVGVAAGLTVYTLTRLLDKLFNMR